MDPNIQTAQPQQSTSRPPNSNAFNLRVVHVDGMRHVRAHHHGFRNAALQCPRGRPRDAAEGMLQQRTGCSLRRAGADLQQPAREQKGMAFGHDWGCGDSSQTAHQEGIPTDSPLRGQSAQSCGCWAPSPSHRTCQQTPACVHSEMTPKPCRQACAIARPDLCAAEDRVEVVQAGCEDELAVDTAQGLEETRDWVRAKMVDASNIKQQKAVKNNSNSKKQQQEAAKSNSNSKQQQQKADTATYTTLQVVEAELKVAQQLRGHPCSLRNQGNELRMVVRGLRQRIRIRL